MARQWTSEERAKQAALIRKNRIWEHSTGAKTPEGKAVSNMNAYKGGQRAKERAKRQESREVVRALDAAFTRRGYLRRGFKFGKDD